MPIKSVIRSKPKKRKKNIKIEKKPKGSEKLQPTKFPEMRKKTRKVKKPKKAEIAKKPKVSK